MSDHLSVPELEELTELVKASPSDEGTVDLIVARPGDNERQILTEGELDLGSRLETLGRPFFLSLGAFLVWLAASEMWLLREPWIVLPKRIFQSVALTLFALGAALPSRRMATVLGAIALPLVILALATVRAKLA